MTPEQLRQRSEELKAWFNKLYEEPKPTTWQRIKRWFK